MAGGGATGSGKNGPPAVFPLLGPVAYILVACILDESLSFRLLSTAMDTALEIEKIVCHQCYMMLDVADNFCRQCGTATENVPNGNLARPAGARPQPGTKPGWSESPWVVLASLFFFIGPLALPMLWRSRRFSTVWKILITVAVVALTAMVLWSIWYLFAKALQPLHDLKALRRL